MTAPISDVLLMLALFAAGALGGALMRRGPLSAWVALALPLVMPPVGIFLTETFC